MNISVIQCTMSTNTVLHSKDTRFPSLFFLASKDYDLLGKTEGKFAPPLYGRLAVLKRSGLVVISGVYISKHPILYVVLETDVASVEYTGGCRSHKHTHSEKPPHAAFQY